MPLFAPPVANLLEHSSAGLLPVQVRAERSLHPIGGFWIAGLIVPLRLGHRGGGLAATRPTLEVKP